MKGARGDLLRNNGQRVNPGRRASDINSNNDPVRVIDSLSVHGELIHADDRGSGSGSRSGSGRSWDIGHQVQQVPYSQGGVPLLQQQYPAAGPQKRLYADSQASQQRQIVLQPFHDESSEQTLTSKEYQTIAAPEEHTRYYKQQKNALHYRYQSQSNDLW